MVWLDVLHLVAWGQVGVVVRFYLKEGFSSGSVTSPNGALFSDLPANIIGSAIMGLLSPSDLLLLGSPDAALLPVVAAAHLPDARNENLKHDTSSQPRRDNEELQRLSPGIACAALPPSSSLQRNSHLLLGLRTGLCGCLTTYASWVLQSVQLLVGVVPPVPASMPRHSKWLAGLSCLVLGALASQAGLALGQQAGRRLAGAWAAAADAQSSPKHVDIEATSRAVTSPAGPPGTAYTSPLPAGATAPAWIAAVPHLMAAALLVALSSLSIALITAVETGRAAAGGVGDRSIVLWVSILFSPIGCLLRWKLAALNARPATAAVAWFPWGTWVANNLACVIDYAMAIILLRARGLSRTESDVVLAVVAGVSGCLSTVSTLVVEVQKLGMQAGRNMRAAVYLLGSLIPSVVLGLVIFGTAAWTD